MEFTIKSGAPEKQRTGCLVVGVFEGGRLTPAARQIDAASDGYVTGMLRRGDLSGKLGQSLILHDVPGTQCDRLLLVGCGRERDLTDRLYRRINGEATLRLRDTGASEAATFLPEIDIKGRDIHWKVRQTVEVVSDALYRFDRLKSKKVGRRRTLRRLVLNVPARGDLGAAERGLREGKAIAAGMRITKDLANLPGNICTPTYLAQQAQDLARTRKSLTVKVLGEKDMQDLGMGALLAVARGSRQEPQLIVIEYAGHSDKAAPPIALVGKGVTFDSGGISIKPAEAMDEMKFDMTGAACVLGTLVAAAELRLPLNLVGVMPATENLPDGNATKPGDVVVSLSGQTVEILNTDAEGRLILADAITYAERNFKPAVLIDIATLTGACVIALGRHPSGMLSNHTPLANALIEAGQQSLDQVWQLPLWDEYQQQLDSNFADMANIGGREGGTITGACFLWRFAKQLRWAHLDIAGTAWRSGKEKGSTGRPVPLLVQYLLNQAAA